MCFFPLHGIAEVMRAYPKLLSHRQVCVALKERALNNPWICPSTHMAGGVVFGVFLVSAALVATNVLGVAPVDLLTL